MHDGIINLHRDLHDSKRLLLLYIYIWRPARRQVPNYIHGDMHDGIIHLHRDMHDGNRLWLLSTDIHSCPSFLLCIQFLLILNVKSSFLAPALVSPFASCLSDLTHFTSCISFFSNISLSTSRSHLSFLSCA